MEEEHVPRSSFVLAVVALVAASAAGAYGLHRPRAADVAMLYEGHRRVGRAPTPRTGPSDEATPRDARSGAGRSIRRALALTPWALALGLPGRGLHQREIVAVEGVQQAFGRGIRARLVRA